jgi:hypothetical protein
MLERQKQLLESQGQMNKKQDQLGHQQQHIVDQNAAIAREIESINETLQVLIQRHQHERDQLIAQARKIEEEIREERRKNEDEKRRNEELNRQQQGEVTLPPVLVSTDPCQCGNPNIAILQRISTPHGRQMHTSKLKPEIRLLSRQLSTSNGPILLFCSALLPLPFPILSRILKAYSLHKKSFSDC